MIIDEHLGNVRLVLGSINRQSIISSGAFPVNVSELLRRKGVMAGGARSVCLGGHRPQLFGVWAAAPMASLA